MNNITRETTVPTVLNNSHIKTHGMTKAAYVFSLFDIDYSYVNVTG